MYAHEVIYIDYVCMVAILHNGVLLCISSKLCVQCW